MYRHGDIVRRRNRPDERGTVLGAPKKLGGQYYYKVLFEKSPIAADVAESDIEEVALGQTVEDLLWQGAFADKVTFSRLLTFVRLDTPLYDNIYALRASRARFEPYQFKPLLKLLQSSNQRLLLADEVGLGKTIEAGFILSEIVARHPHTFRRALIVCKASLCSKWQMEMRRRFDFHFEIWKADRLLQFLDEYAENPDIELKAICSLESFRQRHLMRRWEETAPPLDVLIIDEAHHLKNTQTLSHRACRQAAETSDVVLALTATPIQIGSRDLFNLLSLLDPEQFSSFEFFEACMRVNEKIVQAERLITRSAPDRFQRIRQTLQSLEKDPAPLHWLEFGQAWDVVRRQVIEHPLFHDVLTRLREARPDSVRDTVEIHRQLSELNFLSRIVTRTRKRDVQVGAIREARVIEVKLSPAELTFYKAVVDYVRKSYEASGWSAALLFGLIMPQRQVASCIPAMVDYYREELREQVLAGGLDTEQSDLDLSEWEDAVGEQAFSRKALLEIISRWHDDGAPDTKFETLLQCLKGLDESQPDQQIVIFSYFKKTLEYLSRRLTALGYSNLIISGAYSPEEREERIAKFRSGKIRILLSSEVGSEGLDFQFCHILFNYDLPWNPMVVEQRIGRLDRYGQTAEKILIFTLSAPDTIEDVILKRLYSRINIFQSYIGDLDTILGDTINQLTRDLFDPRLSEAQRKEKIDQAAQVLERRRQQFEEWERESAKFVGQDEFYLQEIRRADELGRFISADDLRVFVEEFLAKYDASSELKPATTPGVFRLKVSERLLRFIQGLPEEPPKPTFLQDAAMGRLRLTFDSSIAEREPALIFLHVRHPFVRGIVKYYREHRQDFHAIARVRIEATDGAPAGEYLYVVAVVTIFAARFPERERKALLAAIVSLESFCALDPDTSEIVLGEMIRKGATASYPAQENEKFRRAWEVAYKELEHRFDAQKKEAIRINEEMVNLRLDSIRKSYDSKIRKKENLLAQARQRGREARYIRMLEGSIRNLKAERASRLEEIERLRSVTGEFSIIAAGYLHVV